MFNKARYYQNRGTNIKSHAHTTEFHLQNVPGEGGLHGPLREDPPRPSVQGAGEARGGDKRGRLKTVHMKAQKEPANGLITMIQVQIKTKTKTRADTAGYAAKNQTAAPAGHPGGAAAALPASLSRSLSHSLSR